MIWFCLFFLLFFPTPEAAGSGEESDVLSINADTYDSDIEGPKDEPPPKAAVVGGKAGEPSDPATKPDEPADPETKKDIQSDIDRSVNEILALSPAAGQAGDTEPKAVAAAAVAVAHGLDTDSISQPSIQQLELLELEMRARAIKALMKAGDKKKLCITNDT